MSESKESTQKSSSTPAAPNVAINKTVYACLLAVMGEVNAIPKDGFNAQFNFHYIKHETIFNSIRAALVKHGVYFAPVWENLTMEVGKTSNNKDINICRIKFNFLFRSVHDGSEVSYPWEAESNDTSDKAISKAITFAVKTFLKAFFLIAESPADDPDGQGQDVKGVQPRETQSPATPNNTLSVKAIAAIRGDAAFKAFRDMCATKGVDPVATAQQACAEGITGKAKLLEYATNLTGNTQIDPLTLDSLTSALGERGGVKSGTQLNPDGITIIREALHIVEPITGYDLKAMKEEDAQTVLGYLANSQ